MPSGFYNRTKEQKLRLKEMCLKNGFKKGHKSFLTEASGKKISEALKGDKNYAWKGEDVGYRALHRWVEYMKGKPSCCEHCGKIKTTPKSIHWANRSKNYLRDLTDWLSLCASCHKKYDMRIPNPN